MFASVICPFRSLTASEPDNRQMDQRWTEEEQLDGKQEVMEGGKPASVSPLLGLNRAKKQRKLQKYSLRKQSWSVLNDFHTC